MPYHWVDSKPGTNSLTVNPATLPAAVQGTPYNQVVSATGGTAPYTFSIISGSLPPGLSLNTGTGAITGTPTGVGSFSVTIQARDINGNIGSRAYTAFTVRPNPANDPDVQGLIASQAASARRFAEAQVGNVSRHLEDMHDGFDPCFMNGSVGVSTYDPATGTMPSNPQAGNPNPTMTQLSANKACAGHSQTQFPLALWTGGNIQFGSAGVNNANHFSTGGLTFGVDGRIHNALIVGLAVGYGADRTDIGTDGTRSDAHTFDAMFYASYQPFDHWFIDAVAGYGTLNYDNRRFVGLDGSVVSGSRSGSNWFGSVTFSTDVISAVIFCVSACDGSDAGIMRWVTYMLTE